MIKMISYCKKKERRVNWMKEFMFIFRLLLFWLRPRVFSFIFPVITKKRWVCATRIKSPPKWIKYRYLFNIDLISWKYLLKWRLDQTSLVFLFQLFVQDQFEVVFRGKGLFFQKWIVVKARQYFWEVIIKRAQIGFNYRQRWRGLEYLTIGKYHEFD